MKAILQRVTFAEVKVDGNTVGKIDNGFLILLGVAEGDTEKEADALSAKVATLRVFTDENDKMNLSLADIDGEVLVISNFTLYADCSHGRRPNFMKAAKPDIAEPLYEKGIFGADMKVSLLNDGPVTIDIDTRDLKY